MKKGNNAPDIAEIGNRKNAFRIKSKGNGKIIVTL